MSFDTLYGPRFRLWVFAIYAAAAPLVLVGAYRAWQSNMNRPADWLPPRFEETQQLYWFVEHFGGDELLMVSWPGCTFDDPRLEVFAEALLEPAPPVRGTETAVLFRRVLTGPEVFRDLVDTARLSPQEALHRMQGWLVGPDWETTCLVAFISEAGRDDRHAALAWVYQAAEERVGLDPESIHVAGPTADGVAIDQASEEGLLLLNAACFAICSAILIICLRGVVLAGMVFLTAISCQVFAVALIHFTGSYMDSVLLVMASLVYVLSVSAALHLVNYYRDAVHEAGLAGAPRLAVRHALVPCGLAAATTALGLGSLTVSQIVPISRFGAYSAAAVMCGLVILLALLPSLLAQFPPRRWAAGLTPDEPFSPHGDEEGHFDREAMRLRQRQRRRRWGRLFRPVARFHGAILAAAGIALLVTGMGIAQLETTVRIHAMFRDDARVIRDYRWLETHVGPLVPVEVVLLYPRDGEAALLDRLLAVRDIQRSIDALDEVGTTISAATFAPALPEDPRGVMAVVQRTVLRRRLEEARDLLVETQYLLETEDEQMWRISVRVAAHRKLEFGPLLDRLHEVVDEALAAEGEGRPETVITGGVPLVQAAQSQLLLDLFWSFMAAFAMIGLTMGVLLRGARAGLLAMLPNLLPSVLVFGAMGWMGAQVEIGSMMTASAALGIAVDGTLHFVTWFRRGIADGQDRPRAVRFAYTRCGTAMVQTTLVCTLGMLVFSLSAFVPTARFSWLMFSLLFAALVADLIVLPAILVSPLGRVFQPAMRRTAMASRDPSAEPALRL